MHYIIFEFEMRGFLLKTENCIFKIFLELFILNKVKRSKIKAGWAKYHLKKYAAYGAEYIEKEQVLQSYVNRVNDNIIWQYWHQGRENAPELIKKCFESVEKFEGDKKINVLSFDTIENYVKLPDRYYDLLKRRKISIAHFSDILRLYLLKEYGGLWIDSTIFLTGKIPDEVWNSDFCVMQKDPMCDDQQNNMSCFFIRADKESANLKALICALNGYWQENDFALNYFMFEHISTMISSYEGALKEEWDKMPVLSAKDSGLMQKIMFEDFNPAVLEDIKAKTCIHKLSYKAGNCSCSKDTYYNHILEGRIQKL